MIDPFVYTYLPPIMRALGDRFFRALALKTRALDRDGIVFYSDNPHVTWRNDGIVYGYQAYYVILFY